MMGEPVPKELRIHGVGGSPGERLLGLSNPDQALLVAEGVGTAFIARRNDPNIEGYDWGGLTSSSPLQPLWVLLLPFTLLNVAGWMHPPASRISPIRIKSMQTVVHLLCVCLTASWVLYLSVLLIDLVGYQWSRRLAELKAVNSLSLVGLTAEGGTHPIQYIGLVVGSTLVVAVVAGIWRIAGNTQKAFEGRALVGVASETDSTASGWSNEEDLFSETFFYHRATARNRLIAHAVVAILAFSLAIVQTIRMVVRDAETLEMGRLLLPLAALEFLGVGVLAAVSYKTARSGTEDRLRMAPAVVAGLGFALSNAVFSGLILLAEKRLSVWPKLPGARVTTVRGGPELLLTDVWTILVFVSAAMTVAWILKHRRNATDGGIADRTTSPGTRLDGADPGWKQSIRSARGFASAGRSSPMLLRRIVVVFYVVALAASLIRFDPSAGLMPWDWDFTLVSLDRHDTLAFWTWTKEPVPDRTKGLLWQGGAWLLALLPVFAIGLVYRATRSTTARRTVGILWDVFTFWPRRFHPFGVRPYSERAVVELQGRIREHARRGHLVVSAHSQGSILAFAALACCGEVTGRVALITYGSPIRTIYAPVFPAYFGTESVGKLRSMLLDGSNAHRWRNFYRDTDPIGGPVFEPLTNAGLDATNDPSDVRLNDPAIASGANDIPEDDLIEVPRAAWTNVAGHSLYLRELDVKAWVNEVKGSLVERNKEVPTPDPSTTT